MNRPIDGRATCHTEGCDRPAKWGVSEPVFCDECARESQHDARQMGIEQELELFVDVCGMCGAFPMGLGIDARYCPACGNVEVLGPTEKRASGPIDSPVRTVAKGARP